MKKIVTSSSVKWNANYINAPNMTMNTPSPPASSDSMESSDSSSKPNNFPLTRQYRLDFKSTKKSLLHVKIVKDLTQDRICEFIRDALIFTLESPTTVWPEWGQRVVAASLHVNNKIVSEDWFFLPTYFWCNPFGPQIVVGFSGDGMLWEVVRDIFADYTYLFPIDTTLNNDLLNQDSLGAGLLDAEYAPILVSDIGQTLKDNGPSYIRGIHYRKHHALLQQLQLKGT